MIRCALYDRVSTDLQAEYGRSLETQIAALTEYARQHGYQIVGVYTDEALTARKNMKNRHALLRLLNDVRRDKIDLILVTKLDRWFRNVKDYHNTQSILEAHGCNWKTIFEDYDTSTPDGQLKINIMLAVAQNECDRTSARIKDVFRHKIANGEWLGGKPPFGYMCDETHHLIKNPQTAPMVEDMFSYYFTVYSKNQAVEYALRKYGDSVPAGSNLQKMFSREIYTGYRNGVQICEPFLSKEQFNTISRISESRINIVKDDPFLFSSMIICPHCHQKLCGRRAKKVKPSGKVYKYKTYNCCSKYVPDHRRPLIYESTVERYLMEHIVTDLEAQIEFTEHEGHDITPIQDVKKLKAELTRLNTMYQKGRVTDVYYDSEYERITQLINSQDATSSSLLEHMDYFKGNWIDLYNSLSRPNKKAFWKKYIESIYLDEHTHKISGIKFL